MTSSSAPSARSHSRWAIVLAGGEGQRLRALTRRLGYDVPKQFCPLLERETLLELTLRRVALAIDSSRTLTLVTRAHERYFAPLMAAQSERELHRNLLIQPDNRGTAVAIAYAAFALAEIDPAATVAVFPCDHWFDDDAALMRKVERAFALASEFQDLTVALGIAAAQPESGYGWFELGAPILNETPPAEVTRAIWLAGAQRNSFILVARVATLLGLLQRTLPRLHSAFHTVRPVLGTMFEQQTIKSLYRDLPRIEFSQRVLARAPQALAVLPVSDVEWSDLGEPRRVLSLLRRITRTNDRDRLADAIRAHRRRARGAA